MAKKITDLAPGGQITPANAADIQVVGHQGGVDKRFTINLTASGGGGGTGTADGVLKAAGYFYITVAANTQPPALPPAADFSATVGANGAFSITYNKQGGGRLNLAELRPNVFAPASDYYRFPYYISAKSDTDPAPTIVIGQGWDKIDVADATESGGISEARVNQLIAAAAGSFGLNAGQTGAVQTIVNNAIAASGHQSEAEVNALIRTATASILGQAAAANRPADVVSLVVRNKAGSSGVMEIVATLRSGAELKADLPVDMTGDPVIAGAFANGTLTLTRASNKNPIEISGFGTGTGGGGGANIPVAVEADVGKVFTVVRTTRGAFVGAWRAFAGLTQSALDAVKNELQGQINLLAQAVSSLGRVMSWNAILQEFTKGTLTAGGAAFWRQNHEGERTYNHPLEWGFAKWGTGNFVTGGNVNDLREAANHRWALRVPSVAQARYFHDPNANGNPWPGKTTFYTGGGVYATGCDAAAVINNGFLAMCMAIKRKPVALPSNDNLHHRVLWMQNGGVDGQLIGYHNNRLVARVANASGATTARSYTRWLGLIAVPSNEALPPLVNNFSVDFQLPANIANGQKVRLTVHAHIEGNELAPAQLELTIANVAASQTWRNQIFVFDGIANPTADIFYRASSKRIRISVPANGNAPSTANLHFTVGAERQEVVNFRQPTTFSDYPLLAGDSHDQFGDFVEGRDSTVHPGGEIAMFVVFEPKFAEQSPTADMQMAMRVWINGSAQNGGRKIDLGMRLNELFPNGFRPHFGQTRTTTGIDPSTGLPINTMDDYIYYTDLGAARYLAMDVPTNGEGLAMHNAQRGPDGGDKGWGAYSSFADTNKVELKTEVSGLDKSGEKVGMVRYKELLDSRITQTSPSGNLNRRELDMAGVLSLTVSAGIQSSLASSLLITQDYSRTIEVAQLNAEDNSHFLGYSASVSALFSFPIIDGKRYIEYNNRGRDDMEIYSVKGLISSAAE